nr:MAG TPA: hypothetical protein [Caudoviricetes sp.]
MRVRVPPSISFIDVSFIFFILFPRLRPHMAVTGKWFLSYVSLGSIPSIAV